MDLLTHVLVAYLVTFGLVGPQPQYLAAGALAGGLPDADALFFPIARRFPILRHHGITHSILGVSVIAGAGSILAPLILPGVPWVYFLVMEAGGLAHVLQDAFTNFSVPPLLPFSERRLALDADRAINFVTLVVSAVAFYLLLGVERNRVPGSVYLFTVYLLMAFFAAYFAIRLAGRISIGRQIRSRPEFDHVVPTGNPFAWVVLSERVENGRSTTTWGRYVLGKGLVEGPLMVDGPLEPVPHVGSPRSEKEALEWSYPLARKASSIIEGTYHFGEAFEDPVKGWVAVWYSLEFTAFGRSSGVRVRFPKDGAPVEVRSTFYRPLRHAL